MTSLSAAVSLPCMTLTCMAYCIIFWGIYLLPCIFFILINLRDIFLLSGNTVVLTGPFAQINEPAPFGAERPIGIVFPGRFFFTNRAMNLLHTVFYSSGSLPTLYYFIEAESRISCPELLTISASSTSTMNVALPFPSSGLTMRIESSPCIRDRQFRPQPL